MHFRSVMHFRMLALLLHAKLRLFTISTFQLGASVALIKKDKDKQTEREREKSTAQVLVNIRKHEGAASQAKKCI